MSQPKRVENKVFLTQSSLNRAIKNICDVLRRSNCAGAMQYIPELTWMLFLRILDEQETLEAEKAELTGNKFTLSIESPYRWQDWASHQETSLFPASHLKSEKLQRRGLESNREGSLLVFINEQLFPYLKGLGLNSKATSRQKIIGEIISNIERTKIDTEYNLRDVINRVHQISVTNIDPTHIFPLSQIYEGLLLKMGQKSNDGGQFFTPREVVRLMVKVIAPQASETVYDPCCGTGGFLAQAYEYINPAHNNLTSALRLERINETGTFYGREKENLVYPIALANLVLHGINEPHIWHGNTLTNHEIYGGLFQNAPSQFDVILTNPPFGGKESKEAQFNFPYKSSSTQLLFLQHVIDSLKPGGRCSIVVDEGILFRTNDTAFVKTKRKLVETCDLWCIVSLPTGTFAGAGASIKTNILFFTKGQATKKIWYYDLSTIKVNKTVPLASEHFDEFFRLLPDFVESERSWLVTRKQIEDSHYDLKAVNPNSRIEQDTRSLAELVKQMKERNQLIQTNLQELDLYSPDNKS